MLSMFCVGCSSHTYRYMTSFYPTSSAAVHPVSVLHVRVCSCMYVLPPLTCGADLCRIRIYFEVSCFFVVVVRNRNQPPRVCCLLLLVASRSCRYSVDWCWVLRCGAFFGGRGCSLRRGWTGHKAEGTRPHRPPGCIFFYNSFVE